MKTGISSWSLSKFYNKNEFDMIDCAKKLGVTNIDLDLKGSNYDFVNVSETTACEHYTQLKDYAYTNGIRFNQTHAAYTTYPNFTSDQYFKKIVQTIKCTSYLNAKYMVFHPLVFPYDSYFEVEEEIQYNIDFINRLIPYLKQYNVKLCLENIYDWKMENGQNIIRLVHYSFPQNLRMLVNKINSEYVGICLDTGHMNIAKENIYNAIKIFDNKLWVLHIHDCFGEKDDHSPLFNGTINWNEVKNGLEDINFTGVFSLEIKPVSNEHDYYLHALNDAVKLVDGLLK